jgi:hypothetical protein
MTPLLKDISVISKRAILKIEINRTVIRSNSIDLRKLNKEKSKKLEKGRAKRKNGNRKKGYDYVVNRSSGKLKGR